MGQASVDSGDRGDLGDLVDDLSPKLTILEAYRLGREHLAACGVAEPAIEAEVLLRYVLGYDRAALYTRWEGPMPAAARARYQDLLEVRATGRPVHYIIGQREFMGLTFAVDERVMIPRPETEVLVEHLVDVVGDFADPILVDVGTGSGCIAVSLAHALPRARVFATDISPEALEVAHANARRHGVDERVVFFQGDLLAPLPENLKARVAAIATNPPYVPQAQAASLPREIREFEPSVALFAPGDGLQAHRKMISAAPEWLAPHGVLAMEVGLGQAQAAVMEVQTHGGYAGVRVLPDALGIERVVVARAAPQ